MKKALFISLYIFLVVFPAAAINDVWEGHLNLPIVFNLETENPTLDSPSQGVKGIPMQVSRPTADSISITIPAIGATYTGKKNGNEITGIFSQRGTEFPLTLTPRQNTLQRPQTPQPPFPYTQEDVSFSNGDALLKGTLTLPAGYSRVTPVLIMITGSGLQNRDEEMFEHKPFAVIADALARNGIASLRYDDRGFGESTGDLLNCTTQDLRDDASAGIDLLRGRFDKVGALGHSEGGTIALMLGADHKVDFIVSLAAMVISGKETLMSQNRYVLTQTDYPQQIVDEYCELLSSVFDNKDSIPQRIGTSSLPVELKSNLAEALKQIKTPAIQYFLTLDMRDRLGNISCPVLALNGTKDTQVSYVQNLEALKKGLPSNNLTKISSLDDLNHLFQHCTTGSTYEYSTIEETISPEVLSTISTWINSLAF